MTFWNVVGGFVFQYFSRCMCFWWLPCHAGRGGIGYRGYFCAAVVPSWSVIMLIGGSFGDADRRAVCALLRDQGVRDDDRQESCC